MIVCIKMGPSKQLRRHIFSSESINLSGPCSVHVLTISVLGRGPSLLVPFLGDSVSYRTRDTFGVLNARDLKVRSIVIPEERIEVGTQFEQYK